MPKIPPKPKREDYDSVMEYYAAYKKWSKARGSAAGDMKYTPEKTWDKAEEFAAKFVKDVRRDKGKESDEAILREVGSGRKYTPKKRKKQIK